MKNISTNILLLVSLIFTSNISLSQVSNCTNDSTVVVFENENNDGDVSFNESTTIYHLDSGSCVSQNSSFQNGGPWNIGPWVNGYYEKTDTIYFSGNIQEILTKVGTINGWSNKSSITYQYSTSNLIMNEYKRVWNGVDWDSLYKKNWTYNAQNNLISKESYNLVLGIWKNESKTNITYNGSEPESKLFSSGDLSGLNWENDSLFTYTYVNNERIGAQLQYWDSLTNSWQNFGQYTYGLQFSSIKSIDIFHVTLNNFTGANIYDTLTYSLDTLDQMVYYSDKDYYSFDISNGNTQLNWDYYSYQYYGDELKIERSVQGQYFIDPASGDSSMQSFYRPIEYTYVYDSLNRLIYIYNYGGLTNPSGGFSAYSFGSNGAPDSIHLNRWTMVHDWDYYTTYQYFDTSSVRLIIPPWDNQALVCPQNIYQPTLAVGGGCWPYRFQWTPNIGLSSDTVLNPEIFVTDSIQYTIVVTDNSGKTDTLLFNIQPVFSITLSVDTSSCLGPAILSVPPSTNARYQWYNNGIAIAGEDSSALITNQPGNYFLTVSGSGSVYNFGFIQCDLNSDTVLISGSPILQSTQQIEICDGESYILPDSVLVNSAGTYQSMMISTQGCDSIITTILTLNNLSAQATTSPILCNGDLSQVIVSAAGGIEPYTGVGSFQLVAGTYNLLISDSLGCVDTLSLSLIDPPALIANAGISDTVCFGQSILLGGAPTGSGGSGALTYSWFPAIDIQNDTIPNPISNPQTTTTYTVLVEDTNACTAISSVTITIDSVANPFIFQSQDTLFSNNTYFSYDWYLNGSLIFSGNYPYIIAANFGNYELIGYDAVGCFANSIIFTYTSTSDIQKDLSSSILIFPNPAKDYFIAKLFSIAEPCQLTIYDLSGKDIFNCELKEESNKISLQSISSGVYILKIQSNDILYNTRMVIQ